MTPTLTHQTEMAAVPPTEGAVLHSGQEAVDERWVSSNQQPSGSRLDAPTGGDPIEKLIAQWVEMAVRHCRVRRMDDEWVADVAGLDGPWSEGPSPELAHAGLSSVLSEWVRLKLADGDRDIPPMEGLRLVVDA